MQQSQFLEILLFCATGTAFVLYQKQKIPTLRDKLQQGTTLNAKERVCTVDEHNRPTAQGHLRSEMRLQNLWHRATYIIIRHVDEQEQEDDYVLVQRRSHLKDYCPNKLDPAPGGVVGFQESYKTNATRELLEEMNIAVGETNETNNEIKYLFTFPYQDDAVRCWGALFEVMYRGSMDDIKLQPEEVSDVLRLSIPELRRILLKKDTTIPDDDNWMPDGLHALKLYLQYQRDNSLKRRYLLKGYSTSDLDRYRLRPKPRVIFFDCDDCLYFDGWKLASALTAKIEEWCTQHKGLPPGRAYELYKKHGTALRGLLAEGHLCDDEEKIDAYLADVHDIPIQDHLTVDNELRDIILQMDPSIPKYIFTASVRAHAERCLQALGIEDLFVDIIDVKSCNLATKHSKEAFEAALRIAKVTDPETCLFLDDSVSNIQTAQSMGIRSILVGLVQRDGGSQKTSPEHAEHEIERIHDIPNVLPELFEHNQQQQQQQQEEEEGEQ